MNFDFTEEQKMFRSTVRQFVQREVAPRAKELDQVPVALDLLKRAGQLGLMAIKFPEEYGGVPGDNIMRGILSEELAKVDRPFARMLNINMYVAWHLLDCQPQVREQWVPGLISGEIVGCQGKTEPESGTDTGAMRMTAQRDGDFYILNGEKNSVAAAMYADLIIVIAKTDPQAGVRGLSHFFCPINLSGISRTPINDLMARQIGGRDIVTFDNVRIPADNLIGKENEGFETLRTRYDWLRITNSLTNLSAAQVSLEDAINYAKQRRAFDRFIGEFEAIAFKIAEDATLLEAARWLSYRALWLVDQGLPHEKEAGMSVWLSNEVGTPAIRDAIHIHGHYGLSCEYPLERRLREAISYEIGGGPPEAPKLLISRQLLGLGTIGF